MIEEAAKIHFELFDDATYYTCHKNEVD